MIYRNKFYILIPIILFVYESIISYGKMFFNIDFNREVYFAQCILNGEVLCKDIFNIFGNLPYYFNASLFYIFGTNLK